MLEDGTGMPVGQDVGGSGERLKAGESTTEEASNEGGGKKELDVMPPRRLRRCKVETEEFFDRMC